MKLILSFLFLLVISSLNCYGQMYIDTNQAKYYGSGCDKKTSNIQVSNSSNQNFISFLFEDFVIELNKNLKIDGASKVCIIQIPIYVKSGTFISVNEPTFSGFFNLKGISKVQFRVSYALDRSEKESINKSFENKIDEHELNFIHVPNLVSFSQLKSGCGQHVTLTVEVLIDGKISISEQNLSSLVASINSNNENEMLQFPVDVKRCNE